MKLWTPYEQDFPRNNNICYWVMRWWEAIETRVIGFAPQALKVFISLSWQNEWWWNGEVEYCSLSCQAVTWTSKHPFLCGCFWTLMMFSILTNTNKQTKMTFDILVKVQLRQKYYTPKFRPRPLDHRQYISCPWGAHLNHWAIMDSLRSAEHHIRLG